MPASRKSKPAPQRPKLRAASKLGPYRVVLLGDAAVGKSSILIRLTEKNFKDRLDPTVGAAFSSHAVNVDDYVVKYEIWDTAGQERFKCLAPMYYRGAHATLLVFDITDRVTFEGAKNWLKEVQRLANPDIIVALTGNKLDMIDNRTVTYEEASSFASEHGLMYSEVSAKTGINVEQVFVDIAKRLPKTLPNPHTPGPISLPLDDRKKEKKCACG